MLDSAEQIVDDEREQTKQGRNEQHAKSGAKS